ncbi:hypothetical protein AHMF7605_18545 [Adhaeribacter arboris]|uniref:Uncharacterized protein n=1 Tax=Adhaeribacter arboris TaxID=2072846 RepID=A0A2T2YIN3_9BACT|nr:hypothetical protein [Adhaeribacter arboris]PSR55362.1 hypothetical protein AHMF7605_18545 [Adhaeribacter arboris]
MKTSIDLSAFARAWFSLIVALLLTFSAAAQEKFYRNPDDLSKGYWKLYTEPASRTAYIKFFDASDRLLYEEVIPDKYIKLTDRNVNRINQVFDQIVSNQMVLAKVKAEPLLVAPTRPLINRNEVKKTLITKKKDRTGSRIQITVFKIPDTTKFFLAFQNPNRERMKIYLKDAAKQELYSENINCAAYTQKFDTVGLDKGKYLLEVTTVNQKYKFAKLIKVGPDIPSLRIEQTDSLLASR